MVAVALLCFALPILPAGVAISDTTVSQTTSLRLLAETTKTIYTAGEPIVVKFRLENVGQKVEVIVVPSKTEMLVGKLSNFSLLVVSSEGTVVSKQTIMLEKYAGDYTSLAPNACWENSVNLLDLFGKLEADTYTVFFRYQVSREDFNGYPQTLQAHHHKWIGSIRSDHLKIKVRAQDQLKTVQKFRMQWLNETNSSKKLRALWWLKDNELRKGMTQEETQKLLGKPNLISSDSKKWTYRVGQTGIHITFEKGKIDKVSPFEI